MSQTLRKQLGRFQVESTAGIAETRENADPANDPQRNRRFLLVIDGERSPVDQAETLQELANLSSAPETRSATIRSDGNSASEVRIANVGWDEMKLLRHRTEFEETPITLHDPTTAGGVSTSAILVKAVKERWTKHHTVPWSPELWVAADEALKRGEVVPDPRYPVVISDREEDGPITSPEALQRLLDLPEVPVVT